MKHVYIKHVSPITKIHRVQGWKWEVPPFTITTNDLLGKKKKKIPVLMTLGSNGLEA